MNRRFASTRPGAVLCAVLLGLLFVPVPPLTAQMAGMQGGAVEAGLLVRQLQGVKRVLMVGAHPDDEDTQLLAALARGMGAETAYLSLTRGDGGQNLIGPELGEGLGVIRTGELEAARAIDGAGQYFTRAFDYGYSKSADEAFRHWPKDEVMRDVVWVIRTFRPQIIVSVWSGTPRDGHGQHWASGIVINEAFEIAADPNAYPDLPGVGGEAWRTDKLYHSRRFGRERPPVVVQVGTLDPLLGRSHFQVAMDSRSQHRSQDMGVPQRLGPFTSGMQLIDATVDDGGENTFFAGIDTTLAGLSVRLDSTPQVEVRTGLGRYLERVRAVEENLEVLNPMASAEDLAAAVRTLRDVRDIVVRELGPDAHESVDIERRLRLTRRALLAAAGVVLDARTTDDMVVAGETVETEVRVWNSGAFTLSDLAIDVMVPHQTFRSGPSLPAPVVEPGTMHEETVSLTMPASTEPDRQYYLAEPRDGDLYRWPADDPGVWGLPRNPSRFVARIRFTFDAKIGSATLAVPIDVRVPVRYVGVDKAFGEFEKPTLVTPAVSVGVQPSVMAWPTADLAPRTLTVVLRNEATAGSRGEVRLELPDGWSSSPTSHAFNLSEPAASRGFAFEVSPGEALTEGSHTIRAVAVTDDGRRFDERVDVIDYEHIPRTLMMHPAETRVTAVPVRVADGLRVGYIMGSGDDGLEVLRQLGVDAREVTATELAAGDFSDFNTLVFGIRVYETRPDVAAVNDQILEFARNGGSVIVQYNKFEYPAGGFAPYEVSMGGRPIARVTDPESPIDFVDPDSPVLTTPNTITMADFDGWVQERGLYFLKEWSPPFTSVIALTDPGEDPMEGSIVVAPVGEGVYAYVALSFFRQFPAGVPGAYRLFANLVSLRP